MKTFIPEYIPPHKVRLVSGQSWDCSEEEKPDYILWADSDGLLMITNAKDETTYVQGGAKFDTLLRGTHWKAPGTVISS